MACGTPVIASEVGGLAYLVKDEHNGFHVPVREPEALAARMTALLEKPEIRKQMGAQALKTAQAHTWPHIADRLLAIFAALPRPAAGQRQDYPPYELGILD
jgi:D-inositol-3-phosphate glycosyltransferase